MARRRNPKTTLSVIICSCALLGACSDDKADTGGSGGTTATSDGTGGSEGTAAGTTEAPGPTVPGVDTVPALITADGTAFAFSADGVRLAISGVDDQVSMWDVAGATQSYTIAETSLSLGFGGDGNTLFTYAAAVNPADANNPILGPAHSWRRPECPPGHGARRGPDDAGRRAQRGSRSNRAPVGRRALALNPALSRSAGVRPKADTEGGREGTA